MLDLKAILWLEDYLQVNEYNFFLILSIACEMNLGGGGGGVRGDIP